MKADKTALEWCNFIDGHHNQSKLPLHIRSHVKRCDRNQRVRELMKNAKSGIEKLNELNQKITLVDQELDTAKSTTTNRKPSSPAKQASTNSHSLSHVWKHPILPPPLSVPKSQALHGCEFLNVGGFCVGTLPKLKPKEKVRRCRRCLRLNRKNPHQCSGRGGEDFCNYFHANGGEKVKVPKGPKIRRCMRCIWLKGENAETCKGRGGQIFCQFYSENDTTKS